jgi:hypothetical protein
MIVFVSSGVRGFFALGLLCGAMVASGCKPDKIGKVVPVSGKVTMGGKALPGGTVNFVPDKDKGNKLPSTPIGTIRGDGTYTLQTEGKEGAPPGWYKVTISAMAPPSQDVPPPDKGGKPAVRPNFQIDPKYSKADTTDKSVEVKENPPPGAYDIKLD